MGSYYQPVSYLKGGKRKSTRRNKSKKGGFYPSVMGGVVSSGKLLIPVALRQGYNLLNNSKTRKRKTLRKKHK